MDRYGVQGLYVTKDGDKLQSSQSLVKDVELVAISRHPGSIQSVIAMSVQVMLRGTVIL